MGEQQQDTLAGAVQSYAHWWREAGLHTAIGDDAHGWRDMPAPFWQREAAAPVAEIRADMPAAPPAAAISTAAPADIDAPQMLARAAPDTMPAFLDWLAQDAAQPEANWDGALMLPPAQQEPRLLVIVEMPALGAADSATLLEAGQLRFIAAMIASLGIAPQDAALMTMATRRPPGGIIDEATLGNLAARTQHYLGLARPKGAIILGDRTSRALLGPHWSPRAPGLPIINHHNATMGAVALASPDLLMGRPMAKAKSWQALRLLQEILTA